MKAHRLHPAARSVALSMLTAGVVAVAVAWGPTTAADVTSAELERLFEARVRPLLVAKCQQCHGEKVAEAGLRLDSRRSLLAGGDSGPAVVPGDVAQSRLLDAVRHAGDVAMPPDERLADDEIAALEAWVAGGVPWTGSGGEADAAAPPSRAEEMATRLTRSLASHWAFTPPRRHPAPELPATFPPELRTAWSASAIDRFIAAAADAAGVVPAAEADPRDLYRRLCLDLTGLPPSAAAADAFCARAAAGGEAADAAVREAVDRMLTSRAHAEHWARKWLDLACYADTMGYAFDGQDPRYPFAWTYRDWVVDALARDLPYDRFVTLQLAADRVEPAVPPSDIAALGFLTVGRTFAGNQHDTIDDRIDLVTRGLLGLTVACARCHDHKYEPVTAADYYGLHGIFASCRVPETPPIIGPAAPGPQAEAFAARLAELEEAVAAHERAVHSRAIRDAVAHAADYFLQAAAAGPRPADHRLPRLDDGYEIEGLLLDRLVRLLDKAETGHPILGPWAMVRGKPEPQIAPVLAALISGWGDAPSSQVVNPLVFHELASSRPATLRDLAAAYARLVARVAPECAGGAAAAADEPPDLAALQRIFGAEGSPFVPPLVDAMRLATRAERDDLRKRKGLITKHFADSPGGPPRAMAVVDADSCVDSHVFLRGNPARLGEKVERRLPQLLGGMAVDRNSSGRLDLARAIVSPDNPLAARVIVNWVWTHHFGRGLVATPGDLGLRGEPPSHPHLLDDLARRFIEDGRFSLRWLHREIVTSRTWRQATTARPGMTERDAENRFFTRAQRRRLAWEAWRDSLLIAAGTLDLGWRGGPGIDPLAEGSMHVRSVYARLDRQNVPSVLRMFDIANPDTAVHVRTQTTVPQQSLAVLNAPLVVAAARGVAARIAREAGPAAADDDLIVALWRAVLARSPAADERAAAAAWLAEEARHDTAAGRTVGLDRWARLAHAMLATAEFQFYD